MCNYCFRPHGTKTLAEIRDEINEVAAQQLKASQVLHGNKPRSIFDRLESIHAKHVARHGYIVVSEKEWNAYIRAMDSSIKQKSDTPYYRGWQLRVL